MRRLFAVCTALVLAFALVGSALAARPEYPDNVILNEKLDIKSFDASRISRESALEWIKQNRLNNGQSVGARKNGYFETVADRENGIVRVDVDVAGLGTPVPQDLLFIVDQSGSMNMYGNDHAVGIHCTSSCLNPDHYYDVPYRYYGTNEPYKEKFGTFPVCATDLPTQNINDFVLGFGEDVLAQIREQIIAGGDTIRVIDGQEMLCYDDGNMNYKSTDFGIFAIKLVNELHFRIDGNGQKQYIAPNGSYDHEVDWQDWPEGYEGAALYWSPEEGNADRCVDRGLLVHSNLRKMTEQFLSNNADNRVGYIGFAESTVWMDKFDHAIPKGVTTTNGYNYTSYLQGFAPAVDMMRTAASQYPNRQRTVIFISDGIPTRDNTAEGNLATLNAATAIRSLPNTTVYAIGVWGGGSVGSMWELSTPGCFMNSTSKDGSDFEAYMEKLTRQVIDSNATLLDEINSDAYELVLDDDHPLRLTLDGGAETAYTYYPDITAAGVVFDNVEQRFEWSLKTTLNGSRLSYYLRLKDEARYLPLYSNAASYPTNLTTTVANADEQYDVVHGADVTVYPPMLPPPTTGDRTPLALLFTLIAASLLGAALVLRRKAQTR